MNAGGNLEHVAHLVGLEMSDEMPLDVKVEQLVILRQRFLNAILAEACCTGFVCFTHTLGIDRLCGQDQRHRLGVAVTGLTRTTDALTNFLDGCSD